jgi:hypothetical protein
LRDRVVGVGPLRDDLLLSHVPIRLEPALHVGADRLPLLRATPVADDRPECLGDAVAERIVARGEERGR